VVCDVCSGTVPSEKHLPEISVAVEGLLRAVSVQMGRHPLERSPGILVGDGNGVFRGSSVVNRHSNDVGLGNNCVEEFMVRRRVRCFYAEPPTVEVDEEGELLALIA